jgi:hypothetical protein
MVQWLVLAVAAGSCRLGVVPLDPGRCAALVGDSDGARAPAPLTAGSLAHAHNDYEHPHPLADALAHGFRSVEADVFRRGGAIVVSHSGYGWKGTLPELYLEPLARRVAERGGSVYGDGQPFYLWIDLKEGDAALQAALRSELEARGALFSRFDDDGGERRGAVTVVLTGDGAAGRALVAGAGPRPFVRDDEHLDVDGRDGDRRWRAYSLEYDRYLAWDGQGAPGADDVARLRCIVAAAHARGRMVRLWAAPDTPAFWRLALASGVDFINSDDLTGLERVLHAELAAR